ncbi:MAG: sigma 54-interacting transcriptional regulator [Deltaproteobacteria bacterium]|nr:sigma 54-interacting transcriptional regulator [Deltaproteobacteria bacterium]
MGLLESATSDDPLKGQPPRLQEQVSNSPVAILIVSHGGVILAANESVLELTGLPPDRIEGQSLVVLWPELVGLIQRHDHQKMATNGLKLSQMPGLRFLVTPLPGQADRLMVAIVDSFQAENVSQAGQKDLLSPFYRQIVENAPDGISVLDERGHLILVNQVSALPTGHSAAELEGRHVSFLDNLSWLNQEVGLESLREKKPITRVIRHFKTNHLIQVTSIPILSADGQTELIAIIERDLTAAVGMADPLEQIQIIKNLHSFSNAPSYEELGGYDMVAKSPLMKRVLDTAIKLARYGVREILLTGESGTGKGLLAKFIHANSKKASEPFIHLNCAAMPENLLEAELFGYEKGVFTGANPGGRAGLFETVGSGTVFLDEIGEMPLSIQAKLLTFLDNHEFRRVGGNRALSSPCTIIAATNRDLRELVAKKLFREDLFFRLNVFCLELPPLRDRPEDILDIAERKLAELNHRYKKSMILDPLAIETLKSYDFPGNARELVNCLHQSVILSPTPRLGVFLKGYLKSRSNGAVPLREITDKAQYLGRRSPKQLNDNLEATERTILLKALSQCRNTREMASQLGISQAGVSRKLRKHNLKPPGRRQNSPLAAIKIANTD